MNISKYITAEVQNRTLRSFAYSFVLGTALSAGAYAGISAAVTTGLAMGSLAALASLTHALTDPFFRKMLAGKNGMGPWEAIARREIIYIGLVVLSSLFSATRIIANRTNLLATIVLDVIAIQMNWNNTNGSYVAIPFA